MVWFESRVVLDGSQTTATVRPDVTGFESRVVLDANKTTSPSRQIIVRLF